MPGGATDDDSMRAVPEQCIGGLRSIAPKDPRTMGVPQGSENSIAQRIPLASLRSITRTSVSTMPPCQYRRQVGGRDRAMSQCESATDPK